MGRHLSVIVKGLFQLAIRPEHYCNFMNGGISYEKRVMVFNPTFNNISVILWQSVLLVEETTDLLQVTDKLLSHDVVHYEKKNNSNQIKKYISYVCCRNHRVKRVKQQRNPHRRRHPRQR